MLLAAVERAKRLERLDIIGEGPLHDALRQRLEAARPALPVVLAGSMAQDDLRRRLVASAAVVVPSTWEEPLALIVAEALACGVPVLATAVAGIAELVIDGGNGLVVPPGDAGALAAAIDRITGDPAFASRLRRHCRERTHVQCYTDVARRLIGEAPAPAS